MILKVFRLFFFFNCSLLIGQNTVSGSIIDQETDLPMVAVKIYDKASGFLTASDSEGKFRFETHKTEMTLVLMTFDNSFQEENITIDKRTSLSLVFSPKVEYLSEVVIRAQRIKAFQLKRLSDTEGTAIYAEKKMRSF